MSQRRTADATKLLIVDDHAVVRMGLVSLFRTAPSFVVVGEAATAEEASAEARRCRPDVVILDVRLPDRSGVEVCREIRSERPETKVLMLSSYSDPDAVLASIMAGAAGYLLKQVPADRLIDAVKVVSDGGSLLDPTVAQTVLGRIRGSPASSEADPFAGLADHERRLLPLLAEGKSNREIATALYLSEHTVKTYVSEILRKLHLTHRAEAAAFIARHPPNSE